MSDGFAPIKVLDIFEPPVQEGTHMKFKSKMASGPQIFQGFQINFIFADFAAEFRFNTEIGTLVGHCGGCL